jgi:LppX_LprAFG lipoprotein
MGSRSARIVGILMVTRFCLFAFVLFGLGPAVARAAQNVPATPAIANDANTLLTNAAEATLANDTLHFSLRNIRGNTKIFTGFRLLGIEGDFQQPDRFQATLKAKALLAKTEIQAVGIGDRFWLKNPILTGNNFNEQKIDPDIIALARPDVVIRLIPQLVSDLTFVGNEQLDGDDSTVLGGTLHLTQLKEIAPDIPTGSIRTDKDLPIQVWIDGDSMIRRIQIDGPFVAYDDDDVIRVIDFSNFDEPVDIEPPM